MKVRISVLAVLAALAVAGCGSATTPTFSISAREAALNKADVKEAQAQTKHKEAVEHKKAAVEAKHKAKVKATQAKKLHEYEQSPEYKKIQAEMRQGQEYERDHKPEEEAHEHEAERRARGELTPEEQKDQEAREHEANTEAEAIREGERLKEEGK